MSVIAKLVQVSNETTFHITEGKSNYNSTYIRWYLNCTKISLEIFELTELESVSFLLSSLHILICMTTLLGLTATINK